MSRLIPPLLLCAAALFCTPPAWAQQAPGGPPSVEARPPTSSGLNAYTPRPAESYSALRVGAAPRVALNVGELGLEAHDQMQRYLLELGSAQEPPVDFGALAASPTQARIMMVDIGLSRTALANTPVLPNPKQDGDLFPGQGYDPRLYPDSFLGPINSVRAAVTITPRGRPAGFEPVIAADARVPTQAAQGAAQILMRAGATRVLPTAAGGLRLGLWGGFETKVLGLLEPVPGGTGGAFLLVPEMGFALTRLSTRYARWGSGEFFNHEAELEAEQAAAIADGRLVISAGARGTLRVVDTEQYITWTGDTEAPYTAAFDGIIFARATWVAWGKLRVHGGYQQVLVHQDDPFIDGFYRSTGPDISLALSGLLMGIIELNGAVSAQRWDGATVRPDDWTEAAPPEAQWWSTAITLGALGRF